MQSYKFIISAQFKILPLSDLWPMSIIKPILDSLIIDFYPMSPHQHFIKIEKWYTSLSQSLGLSINQLLC